MFAHPKIRGRLNSGEKAFHPGTHVSEVTVQARSAIVVLDTLIYSAAAISSERRLPTSGDALRRGPPLPAIAA